MTETSRNPPGALGAPAHPPPTTTVASSKLTSAVGESVTFAATVAIGAPGSGTLTGNVTFKDGGVTLGTGAVIGGVATFSTALLSQATHTITAAYGGDAKFNASADSSSITQVVSAVVPATQQAKLTASNKAAGDYFGAVSVFGDTVLGGASQASPAAYA